MAGGQCSLMAGNTLVRMNSRYTFLSTLIGLGSIVPAALLTEFLCAGTYFTKGQIPIFPSHIVRVVGFHLGLAIAGSKQYKIPHMNKRKLERLGQLPVSVRAVRNPFEDDNSDDGNDADENSEENDEN